MHLDHFDDDRRRSRRRSAVARARGQEAVGQQIRQFEMTSMIRFSRATRSGARRRRDPARIGDWLCAAHAQGAMQGVPNAMQGFTQNRDQPIQIEAATLEMRDKKKEATFIRQCEGGAGRHHHDVEDARGVLREQQGSGHDAARRPARRPREERADAVGRTRARPAASSIKRLEAQRQCGGDPEGPGRDRRDRRVRHQGQSDHHAGRAWC